MELTFKHKTLFDHYDQYVEIQPQSGGLLVEMEAVE